MLIHTQLAPRHEFSRFPLPLIFVSKFGLNFPFQIYLLKPYRQYQATGLI